MKDLKIFNNDEFGQIRTVTIDNEPWFVAKDISDKLGYAQTSNMMKRIDDEDSKSSILDGMNMKSLLINESGLYSAILGSKLESAKRFKRWVTSEVLPTIRKTGSYQKPMTAIEQLQLTQKAVLEVKEQIDSVDRDLQDFKKDMPLLAVECEKITKAVKSKGVEVLGGRSSEAYRNKSLRGKVYSDIHGEVRRQFGVNTYKAIKRSECEKAIDVVSMYKLPMALADEIKDCNAQISL